MLNKTLLLTLAICAIASVVNFQPAYAQISEFKITASDGAADDNFGWEVSISGDYIVVGAIGDDDNGSSSGSAYVFKLNGTSWVQEDKLLASDGVADDLFGRFVSISGDYAVVGAPLQDEKGSDAGSAYVFKRNGTSWVQEDKLLASDGAVNDNFGFSVSISGDYAVIGAPSQDEKGSGAGAAYVFKRTGTSWAQEDKLLASDGVIDDLFGRSVSIWGDYIVVGALEDDDNGSSSGSAYVFKRTGTSWAQEDKLLPSDGAVDDLFGRSVSIWGDYIVVGALFHDDNGLSNSGTAYVFKRTVTSWAEEDKLLPSDGAAEDGFGISVSISGDYVVVGAIEDDDNGSSSGSSYLFKRTGTSWAQQDKLLPSDGAADDLFGRSVYISGDCIVVGSLLDDDNGSSSGSAYVFCGFTSPIGVESHRTGIPAEYSLSQNYPNPFNPSSTIEYTLPRPGDVSLVVYNLRGEAVAFLINGAMPAGNHRVIWDASNVSSGIYFYRLQTGDFVRTRKMVLLK